MRQKIFIIITIFVFGSLQVGAQFGGGTTFDFLNLTNSARVAALGGSQVGLVDDKDMNFAYHNPATLTENHHKNLLFNYINYLSDIKMGYAGYSQTFEGVGNFSAGMHFVDYGRFVEALETGEKTGDFFTASEYAFNIIYSRKIYANYRIGVNLKPVYSALEAYSSFGIAADIGFSWIDSTGLFSGGIVFKNIGGQITSFYNDGLKEPMPFDIQAGFAVRLAHAPLRLSITAHRLHQWNLSDYETWNYENGEETNYQIGNSDTPLRQLARHLIIGAELIPSDNFSISLGYNYQRRKELAISELPGFIGFSAGVNIKISKFRFSYGIASYHLASSSNHFSISTSLSEFF